MIEICGCYNYSSGTTKDMVGSMLTGFVNQNILDIRKYKLRNISVGCLLTSQQNHYYQDNGGRTCFVVGNIYSYEDRYGSMFFLKKDINLAKFLINKYKKDGFKFLDYLEGEFAIVIIEGDKLYLMNDKKGLFSIYVLYDDEKFLFSSQAEPIITLNRNFKINERSIADFLIYGFVPNGETFVKGVRNLEPATLMKISKGRVVSKNYFVFRPKNKKSLDERDLTRLNDLFLNGVKKRLLRTPYLELSGGRDTRFILANMLKLNENPVTSTRGKKNDKDVIIADLIARKFNVRNFNCNFEMEPKFRNILRFKFQSIRTYTLMNGIKLDKKQEFKLLKKYGPNKDITGLFGGELLGRNMPPEFESALLLDYPTISSSLLTKFFFDKLTDTDNTVFHANFKGVPNLNSKYYSFLVQVGRSYLNTIEGKNWERPTNFFGFNIHPFVDTDFLLHLFSLNFEQNKFELYEKLYKPYSEFLDVPWTYQAERKTNNLTKIKPEKELPTSIFVDKNDRMGFISFLKKNRILRKDGSEFHNKLINMYYLYTWFRFYYNKLDDAKTFFR